MNAKSKKLTSVLLIVATIISTCALSVFTAYAYPDAPVKEVELYPDQSVTYSSSKMGPNMYHEGKNLSSNDRYVYFNLTFYNSSTGRWVTDNEVRLAKDTWFNKTLSNTRASGTYWRLELRCRHVSLGGRGVGWMW